MSIIKPSNYSLGACFEVPFRLKTAKPKLFCGRTYTVIAEDGNNVYLYTQNWMDGRLDGRRERLMSHEISDAVLDNMLSHLGMSNRSYTLRTHLGESGLWCHRVTWDELLTFCVQPNKGFTSGLCKFYSKHGHMEESKPSYHLFRRDTGIPY